MRVLVITQFAPLPPDQAVEGIYKRLRMFMNAFAKLSVSIEMLCFVPEAMISAYADQDLLDRVQTAFWNHPIRMTLIPIARRTETPWRHYASGIFNFASQPKYHNFTGKAQVDAVVTKLATSPDIVFVHRLGSMAAVLRSRLRPARMYFDLDDLEHKVLLRSSLSRPYWPGKLAYLAQIPALVRAEFLATTRSRFTAVCSEADARHLRRLGFGSNVVVIPNAVTMPPASNDLVRDPVLLFLGSYQYKPNRDAAERLLTRIWPLILARHPTARLVIAGKSFEEIPAYKGANERVEFLGFVADLASLYARVKVVACPIMIGGGTRFKLVEAGSYGKPIVSTRVGAEGLGFKHGEEILIRERDDEFADACVALFKSDELCRSLGDAARQKVAAQYDVKRIEDYIFRLVEGKRGPQWEQESRLHAGK